MKSTLTIIVLLFLLSGCGGGTLSTADNKAVEVNPVVHRVEDKEAGVVCWVYFQQAIDCLPVDETKLAR